MDVRLLGPVEVAVGDRTAVLPGAGERAVLALLALQAGRVVSVDGLIETLWGEQLPANPGNALQLRVSKLRKALVAAGVAEGVLVTRPPGYLLDLDPNRVDALRFASQVAAARRWRDADDVDAALSTYREALGEWRGTPLADFAYEDWAMAEARRLEELRLTALEECLTLELAAGRHVEVVDELERLLLANPLRERLHELHMLALYRAGRQADALAAYQRARTILEEELGLDPSPALSDLEAAILRQDERLKAPSRRTVAERRTLPDRLVSIVGRDDEVAEVAALLTTQRLVTVTGPGGTGKTTVALEAARAIASEADDGAWFVPLAGTSDPTHVTASVADAFGLPQAELLAGETPEGRLARQVRHRRGLLVLDNCEHVIDAAAAAVQRLLDDCPDLRILATSREALAVSGEVQFALPPLRAPDPTTDIADLRAAPAVQLFVERAAAATHGFAPTDEEVRAIARICARLEGMPLAIELAAARAKLLPVVDLAARLDDRFEVLGEGPRTAAARHRTLTAMVDWSYQLLPDAERTLFGRLGAFRSPWSLQDAEDVCGFAPLAEGDVLELVGHLVDRSLVVGAGEGMFRMLEVVRQFAVARLGELGEHTAVMDRQLDRLRRLAKDADAGLRGGQQLEWLRRLRERNDDLRGALQFCLDHPDEHGADGLELAGALGWFWYLGDHEEGRRYLRAILAAVPTAPDHLRGVAWRALAEVGRPSACVVHPSDECADAARRAAAILDGAGDEHAAAMSRVLLAVEGTRDGDAQRWLDELDEASGRFDRGSWESAMADFVRMEILVRNGEAESGLEAGERAAAAFAARGDLWGVTAVRAHQGANLRTIGHIEESLAVSGQAIDVAHKIGLWNTVQLVSAELGLARLANGDEAGAVQLLDQATTVARRFGYLGGEGLALVGHGHLARFAGDLETAITNFTRAIELLQQVGSLPYLAWAQSGHGYALEAAGELVLADVCHRQVLAIARQLRDHGLTALALEGIAGSVVAADPQRAVMLLGVARRLREQHGRPGSPLHAQEVARIGEFAGRALGPAWRERSTEVQQADRDDDLIAAL